MNKPSKKPIKIEKVIITGEAGHGNLLLGRLLAFCGMKMDLEVSFLPHFGFEDGEGTSTATIILAGRTIGSPLVYVPDVLIANSQHGYDQFSGKVKPGGILLMNSNEIQREDESRDDIRIIEIPATHMAIDIGKESITNMVLCGAYIALSKTVDFQNIESNLESFFKELKHNNLQKFNINALREGYNFIKEKRYMHARYLHSVLPSSAKA